MLHHWVPILQNTVNKLFIFPLWPTLYEGCNPCHTFFPCKLHYIKIFPFSVAEVKNIILSFKSKNSSGYDEIMIKILKT
jgi:hypothetical protein